jgi:Peptidase M1 N-terminal domain
MKCLKLGIILVIVISVTTAAPISKAEEVDPNPPRLPRTSIPLRYELAITSKVNSGRTQFEGVVTVLIKMTAISDVITMNSKGLNVISLNLTESGGSKLDNKVTFDVEQDFIFIQSTSRPLVENEQLTVEIAYSGELQLNMLGFYQSSYVDEQGKIR